MSRQVLTKGEELLRGDCLMSKDREWKMVFQVNQSDFKTFYCLKWILIIQHRREQVLWHSVNSQISIFCPQTDGNFVVYGPSGPAWHSDTATTDATRLCMQGDCNLVMYTTDDKPRWQTNSAKGGCNTCSLSLTDEGKLVLEKDGQMIWNSDQNNGMKWCIWNSIWDIISCRPEFPVNLLTL